MKPVVVPVNVNDKMAATLTSPWFVKDKPEYHGHPAGVQVLVNGEKAFAEIHHAIALAKKNISIICWGFQPSMYFIRNGSDSVSYPGVGKVPVQIGKLLEHKAAQGVKVRVLCFAAEVPNLLSAWIPGLAPINVTGSPHTVGESNTPGRWDVRLDDRPRFETDKQYQYDYDWYHRYDDKQAGWNEIRKAIRAATGDKVSQNLQFYSRGFTFSRAKIAVMSHEDKGVDSATSRSLILGPSHHQKTVLVDYDDAESALAFIMGHNMLDEYWDTDQHHAAPTKPWLGRNGIVGPREDFSTKLTGPIVGDVFYNFVTAWKKETGEALPAADFAKYQPRCKKGDNPLSASVPALVQAVRTQVQASPKAQDIKRAYLQAVNNVASYIFIENQYFRWVPLADKIKEVALAQQQDGRKTPVYLFVISNSTDDGVGQGTVNTYRMMAALGRQDTMPGVYKSYEYDDKVAALGQAQQQLKIAQLNDNYSRFPGSTTSNNPYQAKTAEAVQQAKQAVEQAKAKVKQAQSELDALKKGDDSKVDPDKIPHDGAPGLKIHISTLVAPDSPSGGWLETYIHAKLMIVNDAFTTIGSANINTRSMEVDSEMNVLMDRPEVAKALRKKLWGMHTNGHGGGDDLEREFNLWAKIIKHNKDAQSHGQKPVAALRGFVRLSPERKNND